MVLGVDPSLTGTGLARTWESVEITTALVKTEPTDEHDWPAIDARINYIVGRTLAFAPERCVSVIEAPYIPRHGAGKVIARAWLFGLLVDQLLRRGPVIVVEPTLRAKYAADSGNANKRTVLARMRLKHPRLSIPDHNIADAVALLAMGARWQGTPIDGEPTEKQMDAIRAVHWPTKESNR